MLFRQKVLSGGRPIISLNKVVRFPETNPVFTRHNLSSRWRAKLGVRWSF